MPVNTQTIQSSDSNQSEGSACQDFLTGLEISDKSSSRTDNKEVNGSEERDEGESDEVTVNEEDKEKEPNTLEEDELGALELIRHRHEARLMRQAQTRARLAEITARMAEKEILRHRWLPTPIVQPLRAFFTRSGLFSNLTGAALFSLGVCALFVGVSLGLWWRHRS